MKFYNSIEKYIKGKIIQFRCKKILKKRKIFQYIEIETINRCNGTCSFCPVNINEQQRPFSRMNLETFNKIMNELSDIKYSGYIALFSNNEPFMDINIYEYAEIAREKVPNAFIYLYSNGTLLNLEKFLKIIPFLNYIHIDNYSDEDVIQENIKEIMDYIQDKPYLSNKVQLVMRKKNEILSSRGGAAPNKKEEIKEKACCILPFIQMVIRPDGKISLCCNDALGKWTLGNVLEDSLVNIWFGKKYLKIRKELLENGRSNISPCCNKCDTLDMRNGFKKNV